MRRKEGMLMIERIAVIGGDARQMWLAQALLRSGLRVRCAEVPGMDDEPGGLYGALDGAQAAALPMPALTQDGRIRSQRSDGISLDAITQSVPAGAVIFGGGLSRVRAALETHGLRVFDYLDDEALTIENAVPSAEGTLEIAMRELPVTLCGSRCLVVGYGRIGKALSARLHALHAHVTVSARKPADRAAIESAGLRADRTGSYLHDLAQYDCIFNTVPAPILRDEHLRTLRPDCLLIDLASGSGGLAVDAPPELHYIHALGLPGKCAPKTAAEALKTMILRTLAEQEAV